MMKNETWIQLIIGGIILVPLGFLGSNVFDMNKTLSSMTAQVSNTDNRVNRIVEVLPEVKARVAWEETNHAIEGFLVVTNPTEKEPGEWVTTAAVYNRDSSELSVFPIKLDKAHMNYASFVVAGKLKSENPHEASFSELSKYSAELRDVVLIPNNVNLDTSFVFRSSDAEEMSKFLETISGSKPEKTEIKRIRNWKELVEGFEAVNKEIEHNNGSQ
ncbi:hypothetical protein FGL86_06215 [Pistricoccus aurantiacus]|uniref:Uncharacterized protein n=1 Tax=Pistricoccus aurantiacus TaxID=1883414 RepID=A0A5B8SVH9_9GAMM|nr:hypothetical protein [Pistricoccus aurantiacus]QEA38710.1 hypothetical protein FGL86_06215 [Pistricoccus aurantiacus]